jgi:hypothetical protein
MIPDQARIGRHHPRLFRAVVVIAPLIVFVSIILWFSQNPLSPNPSVEASTANPVGYLVSNFVYDGITNIENIVVSIVFLPIVCFYFPTELRILAVYLLPFITVGAGALAEFTAISAPYVSVHFCPSSCSFYGMSGVASATIGFTVACFSVSFSLVVLQNRGRISLKRENGSDVTLPAQSQLVLVATFVAYLILLLFFAGLLQLPVHSVGHPSSGGTSSPPPPPPAILVESPPVAFVHSASLLYGFVLCLAIFIQVNRRYHILTFSSKTQK